MPTISTITTEQFCSICRQVTTHRNGHCVEWSDELRDESVRWMRLKQKCLMIVTATLCLIAINWAMAQEYSSDDVTRTAMGAVASGIAIWFSTSKKREDKVE